MVWFGWSVDEKYRHEERGLTFKCQAFKRRQLRQGQRGQIHITAVDDRQTTTTTRAAGFLEVTIARGTGLIQNRKNIWLMSGFRKAHQVQTLILNVVMYEA